MTIKYPDGLVAFWFLNGGPDRIAILRQLDELVAQHFSAVVIHPRDGLQILYLSDEWFGFMRWLIDAAGEKGLGVWFYDENPYPSGTAGGLLLDQYPELAGHSLHAEIRVASSKDRSIRLSYPGAHHMLGIYAAPLDDSGKRTDDFTNITRHAGIIGRKWSTAKISTDTYGPTFYPEERACEHWRAVLQGDQWEVNWPAPSPGNDYLILAIWQITASDGRHGRYVDLLNPRTTEKFIEMTYQRTYDELGPEYFSRFQAAFTDEAKLCHPYPWTASLPDDYRKAYQRDLLADLPYLITDVTPRGEAARLRYRRLLGQLWAGRYSQSIGRWCENHGIPFTGHYSPEEDPLLQATYTPGWMQATNAMHWPGCDQISSRFGTLGDGYRILAPKLASSVAHQHGRQHVIVEALGVSGEGNTLQRMRRTLDCLAACGCNRFTLHGQMMSMVGNRKREAPPSIFVQQPYWPFMHLLSDHMARWSQWLLQGRPIRPIALLYPTCVFESRIPRDPEATIWAQRFGNLVAQMMAAGLDFDIVSDVDLSDESITRRTPSGFSVGHADYETLIVPDLPILDPATAAIIATLPVQGTETVIRLLGSEQTVRIKVAANEGKDILSPLISQCRSWLKLDGDAVYVQSRMVDGVVKRAVWNPCDHPIRLTINDKNFELGAGQRWFTGEDLPANTPGIASELFWIGPWRLTPAAQNTLRLDRWNLQQKDGTTTIVQIPDPRGMHPQVEPGQTVLLTTTFELESSIPQLQLSWDRLAFSAPARIWINEKLLEMPDATGEFPADTLEVSVRDLIKKGINHLRLEIGPMATNNVALSEPLYLCGDFETTSTTPVPGIRPSQAISVPRPRDWSNLGFPHYSGLMTYSAELAVPEEHGTVWLQANDAQHDPFEIKVNGQPMGQCAWRPWRLDLTPALRVGTNTVEITVANTLINQVEGNPQASGLLELPHLYMMKQFFSWNSSRKLRLTFPTNGGRDEGVN